MQFIKTKRNELLKVAIFILTTILILLLTNMKLKDAILWPYEKKARITIIAFSFLFYIYSLYFCMKPSQKWYKLMYQFVPSVVLVYGILFINSKWMNFIPYLLPVVLVVLSYPIINALFFQIFTVLLYYFTGCLSEELMMFYLFFGLVVIFLAKYAKTKIQYIFSLIMTVVIYFIIASDYQYLVYEKIQFVNLLKAFIPLIITLIPLYGKFVLVQINEFILNRKLYTICDDENELLLLLMDKNPESYCHSMQVSDFAVKVARKMKVNVNLVNAGARFHEIGKLRDKNYISSGIQILQKNKYPREIIRIIKEHNSKMNKPTTIESAIVMLADTVETTIANLQNTKNLAGNINRKRIIQNVLDIRFDSGMLSEAITDLETYQKLRYAFLSV